MTAPIAPVVRAGDREREKTADQLGQALAQGYLEMTEYETRLQAAFSAHTTADLRLLVADLPLAQLRRNDPRRQAARRKAARRGVQIHLAAYLTMVFIVLTVWLAVGLTAGAWYFWPIWPILGAGIGVVSHALTVRSVQPGSRSASMQVGHAGPVWPGCSSGVGRLSWH
ncbi:DUF1707 domain-containing protein [Mycobacterium deserti]|uniref:DUF1707 domain-containing protein n=1 Tax=Mycobacterium deserti TaxID=2978347 RepID=A0ABT2M8L2_9MYCO|nr:DUF1707 domain-containing protein [Mycobacterium deserti]MCT7658612.1 DUF1707 domain-containing protein [Mycobacterium deserti]